MDIQRATTIFKALSNGQRLKLFLMVYKNCCGASEGYEKAFTKACGCMGLTKSTISHHFKELRRAGLIRAVRKGQSFTYTVNQEAVSALQNWLR